MALGNFFKQTKNKMTGLMDRFFYADSAQRDAREEDEEAQQPEAPYAQQPYQQMNYQQPYQPQYQQTAYQQPLPSRQADAFDPLFGQQSAQQPRQYAPYQQPQMNYQQQPYQPQYQQQAQPLYTQFSAQQPQQPRNRRMQQHMNREENVVPFPGQYQQEQPQQPQAPLQMQQPQTAEKALNMRIMNVRGINECRSAIALLRAGDALIVVMDSVSDPAEMRRYVDTLSGACFSLSATITKVSRYGAYLLAPGIINVFADQITSQMNGAPRPAQPQQPRYNAPQQSGYQPQGFGRYQPQYQAQDYRPQAYQQPQYQAQPRQDAQGFARRSPAPEVQSAAFFAQRPQNEPETPPFEAQPAGSGYAPDRVDYAADQENMAEAE